MALFLFGLDPDPRVNWVLKACLWPDPRKWRRHPQGAKWKRWDVLEESITSNSDGPRCSPLQGKRLTPHCHWDATGRGRGSGSLCDLSKVIQLVGLQDGGVLQP